MSSEVVPGCEKNNWYHSKEKICCSAIILIIAAVLDCYYIVCYRRYVSLKPLLSYVINATVDI